MHNNKNLFSSMNKFKAGQLMICGTLAVGLLLSGCSNAAAATKPSKTASAAQKAFSATNSQDAIYSQGTVEVTEVSINTKVPGRIDKIHIEEGKTVKAGDVLVEIACDELKAKEQQCLAVVEQAKAAYEAAKGQVTAANAQLNKAENGAREQEIAQAQAAYDLWEKTYQRVNNLYEKGAVSAQKLDEVKTQLEVSRQTLSLAKEGARREDKSSAQALVTQALSMQEAAKGRLDQAQAGLEEVQSYIKDTQIKAPIDGTITALNSHEGELVSSGMSIATVSNLSNAWVEVKVKETDLENIANGQKVNIKIPGFSSKDYTGKVVRISQKPDFATKRSTNDNGDFDVLSYGVKIQLDNTSAELKPGMTAFVQFEKQG